VKARCAALARADATAASAPGPRTVVAQSARTLADVATTATAGRRKWAGRPRRRSGGWPIALRAVKKRNLRANRSLTFGQVWGPVPTRGVPRAPTLLGHVPRARAITSPPACIPNSASRRGPLRNARRACSRGGRGTPGGAPEATADLGPSIPTQVLRRPVGSSRCVHVLSRVDRVVGSCDVATPQAASAASRTKRLCNRSASFGLRGRAWAVSVINPTAATALRTSGSPTVTDPAAAASAT
jgi:hypothetical protein